MKRTSAIGLIAIGGPIHQLPRASDKDQGRCGSEHPLSPISLRSGRADASLNGIDEVRRHSRLADGFLQQLLDAQTRFLDTGAIGAYFEVTQHLVVRLDEQLVYSAFNLSYRLAEGMAWHFTFMWLFAINGILYAACTIVSGEWRYPVPTQAVALDQFHDHHVGPLPGQQSIHVRLARR